MKTNIPNISGITSARFPLRAKKEHAGILAFMGSEWIDRFKAAIKQAMKDGQSMRSISMKAGLSVNYVDQLMKGSQPTVDKFLAICAAINRDPVEILTGAAPGDPEAGRALRMFADLEPDQRKALLMMMESIAREKTPEGETSR